MPEHLDNDGWVFLRVPVPPELVRIGAAPCLQRFFDAMIYKLRRNAHKGRWETLPLDKAFKDLRGEVEELDETIRSGSTAEILMEGADVANEALIVSEIALEARTAQGLRATGPAISGVGGELPHSNGDARRPAAEPKANGKIAPGF
jgi:hypothetical protein